MGWSMGWGMGWYKNMVSEGWDMRSEGGEAW